MSRPNPAYLIGFALVIVAAMGGAVLLKGGIYISKHEGDTLHLLEIVLRMAQGETPHEDFLTPIGYLAFAPISLFVAQGLGFAMAFTLAQILVALMILPAAVWTSYTRLNGALAFLFTAFVMVLPLALVHGQSEQSISLSMHYNRFAWALAFITIALATLPALRRDSQSVDGAIIGLAMGVLAMMKITYFICFAPPILIALIMRKQTRAILAGLAGGAVVALLSTLYGGFDFWAAYVGDLLTVIGSGVREAPSAPLNEVAASSAYITATVAALLGIIFLRQSREAVGGVVMLLLFPAFLYVTYQNFGNDPQWVWLLAVLLLTLRPAADVVNGWGWNMRQGLTVVAIVALTTGAPSFLNLLFSPFRHMSEDVTTFTPLLSRAPQHADLQIYDVRAFRMNFNVDAEGVGQTYRVREDRTSEDDLSLLKGETLPYCEVTLGMVTWMETLATSLEEEGFAKGNALFITDLLPGLWMYSDGLKPTQDSAPWYYGGLPGFEKADYVLVPLCPISARMRGTVLRALEARGSDDLVEVFRNDLYIVLKRAGGA